MRVRQIAGKWSSRDFLTTTAAAGTCAFYLLRPPCQH
jgi:hypothetical protein